MRDPDEYLQSIYEIGHTIPSPANDPGTGVSQRHVKSASSTTGHELAQALVRFLSQNVEEPKDRHLTVHK